MAETAERTTGTCEFRRCEQSGLPELVQALAAAYPHNPRLRESDYLQWQYCQAPAADDLQPHIWLDRRDDGISGWLGCVPIDIVHQGSPVKGCYLQNWHSRSRDGAGLALFLKAVAPYPVRLMLGTTPEADRFYAALKIPRLPAMPRWVGFPEPVQACQIFGLVSDQAIARVQASHVSLARAIGAPTESPPWSDDLKAARYQPPAEYGAINGVVRSREWLNWRYREIPEHRYTCMTSPANELVVYRTEQITGLPYHVVRMVEWMVTEQHAASALAEVFRRTQGEQILLIDFSCTSPAVAAGLQKAGFVSIDDFAPDRIPALFRPLHPGPPISLAIDFPPYRTHRIMRWEEWYITRGDADLDRRKL